MKRVALETFLALARLKHFGRTAHFLNTTQSTISARIAGLESDLDVTLFERSAGRVSLTGQGQELLVHATEVLNSMDRMAQAAGADPYREGTLRLALSETLAATILPEFIDAFARARPAASIEMVVDSTSGQRRKLIDRDVDLALLMGPVSRADVANLPLIDLPLIWVVGKTHPLARQSSVSIEDLSVTPITTYAGNSRPYVELSAALRQVGILKPRLFSSNALGASLEITKAGLSLATLPLSYAAPEIAAGTLCEVRTPISLNPLSFTASYRIETGNSLARSAAELAVGTAEQWRASQSNNSISLD